MHEIILNENQIALNKIVINFRKHFLICCYLCIIPTLCLFGVFFYLLIDYHVLKSGTAFGFSISALFYLGIIANIVIIYLTVGAGQFNNQLLIHVDHNTTPKECAGHLSFIRVLYRASAISPIVFGTWLMIVILYSIRNIQPSLTFYLLLTLFYIFTIILSLLNFKKYQNIKKAFNNVDIEQNEVLGVKQ